MEICNVSDNMKWEEKRSQGDRVAKGSEGGGKRERRRIRNRENFNLRNIFVTN